MSEMAKLPVVLEGSRERPEGWIERRVSLSPFGTIRLALPPGVWDGLAPSSLPHLAYLRELWEALGAPPAWRLPKGFGEVVPDALWERPEGTWAVEVDLRYPVSKVERKVRAYRAAYAGQAWGVFSRARARLVSTLCWPKPCQVVLLRRGRSKG